MKTLVYFTSNFVRKQQNGKMILKMFFFGALENKAAHSSH